MSKRECVTHHFACDCREEYMRKLEKVAQAAREHARENKELTALRLFAALAELDGDKK